MAERRSAGRYESAASWNGLPMSDSATPNVSRARRFASTRNPRRSTTICEIGASAAAAARTPPP
jgi:hypothetical protein